MLVLVPTNHLGCVRVLGVARSSLGGVPGNPLDYVRALSVAGNHLSCVKALGISRNYRLMVQFGTDKK